MNDTCVERINAIKGINMYRGIVSAVGTAAASTSAGNPLTKYAFDKFFPDPVEYALKIEGAPSAIKKRAEVLGPNDEDETSIFSLYKNTIKNDLESKIADLDNHWDGDAAQEFTGVYLPELTKHILDLAEACETHRDAAIKIQERIISAHNELVKTVREMVAEVISRATVGAASEGIGAAGVGGVTALVGGTAAVSISTAGIGAVVIGAAVALYIVEALINYHSQIEGVLDSLNTDLGVELVNSLDKIEQQQFGKAVDHYVSKTRWHPPVSE